MLEKSFGENKTSRINLHDLFMAVRVLNIELEANVGCQLRNCKLPVHCWGHDTWGIKNCKLLQAKHTYEIVGRPRINLILVLDGCTSDMSYPVLQCLDA